MAKAKNEAKIKFNADVSEFNDSIKQANREMAELRAEMKLNDTQMKGTGDSAEGLERQHDILQRQLKASEDKVEALSNKLKSAEDIFGKNSEEASRLRIQLMNAQTAEEKLKQAVNGSTNELKDQKNAAKDAGDGFTVMRGALANLVSSGIQLGIQKIGELAGYLAELPMETMELRQDMATLTTSFDDMGFSTKTAKETWSDLYAVFGEDDRAVEASNLIAKMSKDQQDLDDWTTITTGAWAKFQDSLPVEGLAEASMESAKTGVVTGNLADALNWAAKEGETFGVKLKKNTKENEEWNEAVKEAKTAEDFFNLALSECSNEQERQQLITSTLKDIYGESADTYRETAGSQMEAKEAAAAQMQAEAELAETIEPVTTEFTKLKTELLEGITPVMERVSEVATDALEWMREHPTAMQALGAAVGVLAVGLGGLAIAAGVYTAAQWAMNSAILANPITWVVVAIIAAIAALAAVVVVVKKHWDDIKKKTSEVWNSVKEAVSNAVEKVKQVVSKVWNSVKTATNNAWNAVKNGISKAINAIKNTVSKVFDAIKKAISKAWNSVKTGTTNAWNAVKNAVTKTINSIKTNVSKVFNAVKTAITTVWNGVKSTTTNVWNGVKAKVASIVNGVKNTVVNTFNSVKSKVASIWNGIKTAISNPINAAKQAVQSGISKIKSLFSGLKLSLPKFKLPHFNISGGKAPWGLGGQGTKPKISVDWYAKGGILTKPTIFGANGGNLMAGGEAGKEAVLPIAVLQDYINRAFDRNVYAYAAAGGAGDVYNVYVNDARINDDAQMREVTKDFLTEIVRLGGMNR